MVGMVISFEEFTCPSLLSNQCNFLLLRENQGATPHVHVVSAKEGFLTTLDAECRDVHVKDF